MLAVLRVIGGEKFAITLKRKRSQHKEQDLIAASIGYVKYAMVEVFLCDHLHCFEPQESGDNEGRSLIGLQ